MSQLGTSTSSFFRDRVFFIFQKIKRFKFSFCFTIKKGHILKVIFHSKHYIGSPLLNKQNLGVYIIVEFTVL